MLRHLDQHFDCRLVGTIAGLIRDVFQHRQRPCGLLLSELGAYLSGPDHALVDTKPLSNLLQSVMAYARRWQIEVCFRFNKTELALESPRLWTFERRRKLLMLVTLVYALLLALLQLPNRGREPYSEDGATEQYSGAGIPRLRCTESEPLSRLSSLTVRP